MGTGYWALGTGYQVLEVPVLGIGYWVPSVGRKCYYVMVIGYQVVRALVQYNDHWIPSSVGSSTEEW